MEHSVSPFMKGRLGGICLRVERITYSSAFIKRTETHEQGHASTYGKMLMSDVSCLMSNSGAPMHIYFPGGAKVYADHHGFTIQTDQPVSREDPGSAPTPFDLFLASIGTCAGIYVLGFCQQRNIPTEGISLDMHQVYDQASGMITNVSIDISVPADFPEQYKPSLIKVAELCKVKKHLAAPPAFSIQVK